MGANVSNKMVDSTTDLVSEIMNKISTEIENESTSYIVSDQYMYVSIKNSNINCSIKVKQDAVVSLSTMLSNSNTLSNDLTSALLSKITEKMTNDLTQANKGLNIGSLNVSNAEQKTKTYLKQNLTTDIETGIKNSISQTIDGRQKLYFDVESSNIKCPRSGKIEIDQSMLIDAVSRNIASNIVNNTIKNLVSGSIEKKMKNKLKQDNEGLGNLMVLIIGVIITICMGLTILKNYMGKNHLNDESQYNNPAEGEYVNYYDTGTTPDDTVNINTVLGGKGRRLNNYEDDDYEDDDYDDNDTFVESLKTGGIWLGGLVVIYIFYIGYILPEKQKNIDKYELAHLD